VLLSVLCKLCFCLCVIHGVTFLCTESHTLGALPQTPFKDFLKKVPENPKNLKLFWENAHPNYM
jgi:hypothetical protein